MAKQKTPLISSLLAGFLFSSAGNAEMQLLLDTNFLAQPNQTSPEAQPPAPAPAQPAAQPNQPSQPPKEQPMPTPEQLRQQLVQQILQMNFQRTPAAILRAEAEVAEAEARRKAGEPEEEEPGQPEGAPNQKAPDTDDDATPQEGQPAPNPPANPAQSQAATPAQKALQEVAKEAKTFSQNVLLGRWTAVGEVFKKLPEAEGRQVFQKIVQQLQTPLQQQRQNRQQLGKPDLQIMVPEEILALAQAVAFPLKDQDLAMLAGLLKQAQTHGFPHEPLVAALQKGTPVFGGEDPAKKLLAAKLLTKSGLPIEAASFLPTIEQALKDQNAGALLVHAEAQLAIALKETTEGPKLKSWELVLTVLGLPKLAKDDKSNAMTQCLNLMDQVPVEKRTEFFQKILTDKPEQAKAIIATAADRQGSPASMANPQQRAQALQLLHEMGTLILAKFNDAERDAWRGTLNLMALPWIDEAVLSTTSLPQQPNQNQYDEDMGYSSSYYPNYNQQQQQQQPQTVETEKMLTFAPNADWMAVLEPSIGLRVKLALPEIAIKSNAEDVALKGIGDLAALDPEKATDVANRFIQSWAQKRNPAAHQMSGRYNRYFGSHMYYYGGYMQHGGIPITRSLQVRNIEEMAKVMDGLRKLPLKKLDGDGLAGAFSAIHSSAEVFLGEDIEKVFGPAESIDHEILTNLIDTMRQRLATVWRQAKTQEAAKTKRTDKEIIAEVQRGYDVATQLIKPNLNDDPVRWRFHLIHAALSFDWAEFKYGNKTDLKDYVSKREEAFNAFAKSAELYSKHVAGLKPKDYDIGAFVYWFNANLGASDLSYVTRQQEPSEKNLARIRKAIDALPGEAAQKHLDLFVDMITQGLNSLPAHLKQPYVNAAMKVMGEHEKAKEMKELMVFYADLLKEVEFNVGLDGESSVGQQPFGVIVSLRYTEGIGREADGFRKYLTNQSQNQYYYNPYGTAPQDYRDQFEKQVKEKFEEGFEVISISFADPKEQSRAYGRHGWRETPYAYLLLKAKNPTVDTLPALKLDLDFADQYGQVLLPKSSSVVSLDAKSDTPPSRPVSAVEIAQVLDERELGSKGILTLDIKATGKGILPDLGKMVALEFPGFITKDVATQGISITKFGTEEDGSLASSCERNWLLTLELDPKAFPREFKFPVPLLQGVKVVTKAYRDADLIDVPAILALQNIPVKTWQAGFRKYWIAFTSGIVLLTGLLAFIVFRMLRRKPAAASAAPRHRLPAHATPFNILALLQNLRNDKELNLPQDKLGELDQAIAQLEQSYFSPGAAQARPEQNQDLITLATRWLKSVGM